MVFDLFESVKYLKISLFLRQNVQLLKKNFRWQNKKLEKNAFFNENKYFF